MVQVVAPVRVRRWTWGHAGSVVVVVGIMRTLILELTLRLFSILDRVDILGQALLANLLTLMEADRMKKLLLWLRCKVWYGSHKLKPVSGFSRTSGIYEPDRYKDRMLLSCERCHTIRGYYDGGGSL